MTSTTARRRFVSISLRNSQPAATVNATATMRTAAAATHRSIYTSDSGWFRTGATAAAPLQQAIVVPNASASASTSMRGYGASKTSILFQYKAQQLDTTHSFSKLPYSTKAPVAAISEAETATESPVHEAATQQWREILFGGLLAVTLTATLVLGLPQTARAEPTLTATSSSGSGSSSNGSPHVTFRPTPKSTSSGNKNGDGSGGAVMLSTQPLGEATNKNSNSARVSPRPVFNSGRSPYDVSVSTTS